MLHRYIGVYSPLHTNNLLKKIKRGRSYKGNALSLLSGRHQNIDVLLYAVNSMSI